MVIRIRLARFGKAHAPAYNIVVQQARTARGAKPIEVIGTYDPIPKPPPDGIGKPIKDIQLDVSRAKYWLGVGAQPSHPVWRLLAMFRLIEPKWQVQRINALVGEQAAQAKVPKIHENSEAHKSKEIGLPGDDSKWVDQLQPNGH